MSEYHKIQTLFKRDMSNRKTLIEGEWTLPEFEYLAGNVWVFTEKVDGTNIRVIFKDGGITFGGRTEDAQIPAQLVTRMNERFLSLAAKFGEVFAHGSAVLYGEGYGAKIQKGGGNYRDDQDFVLFDVLVYNAEYDTIKSCPEHHALLNATLTDLISLRGSVNPAITATLRKKIQSGQQTSSEGRRSTSKPIEVQRHERRQREDATLKQSSDSLLSNTNECFPTRTACAPFAAVAATESVAEENRSRSALTIAMQLDQSEACSVPPVTLQFTKPSEICHGSTRQGCTCKINKWWLQRADVEDVAQKLCIEVVPLIGEGTLHDAVRLAKDGIRSTWGEFLAEGIVARPKTELMTRAGERIITKIKCRDFWTAE